MIALPNKDGTYKVKTLTHGKEEESVRYGRQTRNGFKWLVRYGVEVTDWDRHCKDCICHFNNYCYHHDTCTQDEDECDL